MYKTAPSCLHVYITMGACEHACQKKETTLTELHQLGCKMDASLSVDREGQMVDDGGKCGGWIIFLFMIGTLMCLTLAAGGWQANLVVYLIEEFNVKSIDATQGLVLFTLTATLDSLRPSSCENGSSLCKTPSKIQFAVLYASITLASIGLRGTRFTIATMGANQFDKPKNQGIFFNWFFFAMYTATVVSSTVVCVY
nr:protein NRT1/ PTR FAMILY 2.7-like [Malus domestica]